MQRSFAALLMVLMAAACGPVTPLTNVADEPLPEAATRTEHANLLLDPMADGADLLGRQVHVTEDGKWTIADARTPGCSVELRRRVAKFQLKRRVALSSMTALSAGFAQVVSVEAKYGASDEVDIQIDNTEVLEVDRIAGECGDIVINKVYVGSGSRKLLRKREAGAAVEASIGPVTPGASHAEKGELDDTLSWGADHAYGFTFSNASKAELLTVRVKLPSIVREGEEVAIEIETNRTAWLVVYYLEQNGKGAVMWPSAEEPEPQATTDAPAHLPSANERAQGIRFEARLASPGQATRETLVVYAFENKADFDRVKPIAGATDVNGPQLAAALTQKVEQLPASRWSRAMANYVIQPAPNK